MIFRASVCAADSQPRKAEMLRAVALFCLTFPIISQFALASVVDVGTTSEVDFIAPPKSAETNVLQEDSHIQAFIERQGFILPLTVNVNIWQSGKYDATNVIGVWRNIGPTDHAPKAMTQNGQLGAQVA